MYKSIIRKISNNISISYCITVCNEALELDRLFKVLLPLIGKMDEIIVLSDKSNVSQEVLDVIKKYEHQVKHYSAALNGDFSAFKNNLIRLASKQFLFQIDADEYPNERLISELKSYLFIHFYADCFFIPRVNTVNGLSEEHVQKWSWVVDSKNRINYPDYQMRLFHLGKKIHWENKVHEKLVGYRFKKRLPCKNENFCLYHPKSIEKQERQNALYDAM